MAVAVPISQPTLHRWRTGESSAPVSVADVIRHKWAHYLQASSSYIGQIREEEISIETQVRVAALDASVAAGPGREMQITINDTDEEAVRWVMMDRRLLSAPSRFYRWLRVRGDSMGAAYPDKSWVLVNFLRYNPRQLKDKPVMVWLGREQGATLKILHERKELSDRWILHALHPEEGDRYVFKNEAHLQFAAVEAVWRKIE